MVARVSVHGGHSGEFCNHAKDSLEDIVTTYIAHGFSWVGITEHSPPIGDHFLYGDEKEAGLDAAFLQKRFGQYIIECRRLQKKYASQITIYVGVEIETYSGYDYFIPQLVEKYVPDYIVGSVHFVNDICFDYSQKEYEKAVRSAGGIDALYCLYFDVQHEMISHLKPAVVGHFDLIRLYDPDYRQRLLQPEIFQRIERNLTLVKKFDLILDFNLRSLSKGAEEPYISRSILERAAAMDIAVVPGDDSHGCHDIGLYIDEGIAILDKFRFTTHWKTP